MSGKKNEVRNKNNMLIGRLEDVGDVIIAIHIKKGYVGRYNKSSNITFDKQGKIFCYNDGTVALILDADR